MKRRPRMPATQLRTARRRRVRQRAPWNPPLGRDQACVNASVLYTDPQGPAGTALWLEPAAHGEGALEGET